VTARTRILLLPVIFVALAAFAASAFFLRGICATDGRESSGDKHEWSILQALESEHRTRPVEGVEFVQRHGYHIACVAGDGAQRVWIMLAPRHPPFYKQLPQGRYSLARAQFDRLTATRQASSTVEEALASHVQ
jgi:hypothetical protein